MIKSVVATKCTATLTAAALTGLLFLSFSSRAEAQALTHSDQYQELFMNAGYSTLFGAALGVAVLPFLPSTSVSNLRVIAGGASIGFVAGSLMALYNFRQQQNFGMQYYPDVIPNDRSAPQWQWDVGTSNGQDLFVKMDSHF
ncbi:MAG: hypothetical protein EBR09_08385 [Proteobacteria bacterium]|nr:hypothetical protein [Pseudomonadota bacterium]